MLNIEPVYQRLDSDCGVACVQMILNWLEQNKRGIGGLGSVIDGLQVRTIESYLREKGLRVISGNFDIHMLRHHVRQGAPVICLVRDHYVLVKGFRPRKVLFNCPVRGEVEESLIRFRKRWSMISDRTLVNWGIAAYAS